jgi:antitoxin MazE
MNATIQKWGNSQGIRLPKIILDQLGFYENDKVEITTNENSIILKKVSTSKHITIEERLEKFYGKPIDQIQLIDQVDEIDFGKPVGEEVW